jgi:hypothetical protein
MTDIETLASSLLANFRTIRLPADALPTQPNLEPTDWWATTKALRAEKRASTTFVTGSVASSSSIAIGSSIVWSLIQRADGAYTYSPSMMMLCCSWMALMASDVSPAIRGLRT